MTIRALTFHGKGDVRYETQPDPTPPDAHGAVLRVERAAICGSDLHLYHADLPTADVGFAIGHEFVGEVVEVGSNVYDFHPGDVVSGEGHVTCGLCRHCLAGRRHLCA
ncbi:MAG TPA: alcohol dehydrogenase catalytic domain-containing protein, partial [Myxococcota bacterium]|nr:alcohol dehydrogenase catalytic domain-containing protein [Myxococcota bacterium]